MLQVPLSGEKEIVVAGGCINKERAVSCPWVNTLQFTANHEEADTHGYYMPKKMQAEKYEKSIVISRDTDVLVLLITFKDELSQEVWLQNSTYRETQYIP